MIADCGLRIAEKSGDQDFTPNSELRTLNSNGFTLLEVMVAVAILAMVLVTLLGVKNRSTEDVMLAEHITTATLLAKRVMTETLTPGQQLKETEDQGEFEEVEFKDYTWQKTIAPMKIEGAGNVTITKVRVAVLWKEGMRPELVELVSYE